MRLRIKRCFTACSSETSQIVVRWQSTRLAVAAVGHVRRVAEVVHVVGGRGCMGAQVVVVVHVVAAGDA